LRHFVYFHFLITPLITIALHHAATFAFRCLIFLRLHYFHCLPGAFVIDVIDADTIILLPLHAYMPLPRRHVLFTRHITMPPRHVSFSFYAYIVA